MTIGGGAATGTHGSSLKHGSLSKQALGFKVVLANGSHVEISPHSHPLYFKAFQVNVGRLGVVTHVKMRIIKEALVERTLIKDIPAEDILSKIRDIQEAFKSTGAPPSDFEDTDILFTPDNFTVRPPQEY